jgi:proteasome accessory factor A
LDDPVAAACTWSHDPKLRVGERLVDGAKAPALEIQQRILHAALGHRQVHGFETVPRCDEILELWEDTLTKLAAGDFDALAGRLDWVLKHQILERALEGRPELDWSSPQLKFLDQLYASIDPEQGLFWPYAERGLVEPWVSEEAIARFVDEPPDDTRAWTRAMLLRSFDDHEITRVDWDRISLDTDERGATRHLEIRLDDPLGFTRKEAGFTREEAGLTRKATAALFEGPVSKRRNS